MEKQSRAEPSLRSPDRQPPETTHSGSTGAGNPLRGDNTAYLIYRMRHHREREGGVRGRFRGKDVERAADPRAGRPKGVGKLGEPGGIRTHGPKIKVRRAHQANCPIYPFFEPVQALLDRQLPRAVPLFTHDRHPSRLIPAEDRGERRGRPVADRLPRRALQPWPI